MRPLVRSASLALLAVLPLAACAGSTAAPMPSASAMAADTALEGAFRWTTLDGVPGPLQFPQDARVTLVAGSLELRDAAAAARDGSGRFSLRFTMRAAGDSANTAGEDGRFRIVADSLHFTPDGQEDRPPVRFRYAWSREGVLELTDAQGQVWGYVRQ